MRQRDGETDLYIIMSQREEVLLVVKYGRLPSIITVHPQVPVIQTDRERQ